MAITIGEQTVQVKRPAKRRKSKIVVPADFSEPRTIQEMAEEQRRSMAAIREPLEDVELPPDD